MSLSPNEPTQTSTSRGNEDLFNKFFMKNDAKKESTNQTKGPNRNLNLNNQNRNRNQNPQNKNNTNQNQQLGPNRQNKQNNQNSNQNGNNQQNNQNNRSQNTPANRNNLNNQKKVAPSTTSTLPKKEVTIQDIIGPVTGQTTTETSNNTQEKGSATTTATTTTKEQTGKQNLSRKKLNAIKYHPVNHEIEICDKVLRKIDKMLSTQKRNNINQQTKNKSSGTDNNNVEENTEKEASTETTTDVFATTILEYDMVMNFELLSLTIPKTTEEAVKVRQSLVERKQYYKSLVRVKHGSNPRQKVSNVVLQTEISHFIAAMSFPESDSDKDSANTSPRFDIKEERKKSTPRSSKRTDSNFIILEGAVNKINKEVEKSVVVEEETKDSERERDVEDVIVNQEKEVTQGDNEEIKDSEKTEDNENQEVTKKEEEVTKKEEEQNSEKTEDNENKEETKKEEETKQDSEIKEKIVENEEIKEETKEEAKEEEVKEETNEKEEEKEEGKEEKKEATEETI